MPLRKAELRAALAVHLGLGPREVSKSTRAEGAYLLRAHLPAPELRQAGWTERDPAKLWQTYVQLTEAEAAFRTLKSEVKVRPIWHWTWTERRVEAHMLVAFLGYCLWVCLKKKVERSAPSLTPWQILDQWGRIALVGVWFELRDGRRMCLPRLTQPEPAQAVLSRGEPPQTWRCEDRTVALREVKGLHFGAAGAVRVVRAEERWTERQRRAGRTERVARTSQWRWLATGELDGYGPEVIWRAGHQRWGVENHAFNELTQHYHLTHCPHHEPAAILAWLLILVLGFNLFALFVRLHGKLWRQGRVTLAELARQLDRALEAVAQLQPLWSGCKLGGLLFDMAKVAAER